MEKLPSLDVLNNVSQINIVYKQKVVCKAADRPVITASSEAFQTCLHYWDEGKIELPEEFKVLFLNRANRLLHLFAVSQGGFTGTVANPRLILAAALKLPICSMILVHNHPSGNLQPSCLDVELTRKIKCAASYFDIKVLDHLIISPDGCYSFAGEGLL